MRIHHLNCGCMCPLGGALYDGFSKGVHAHLICHCLLIETERDGLVLVDTGFGEQDMASPTRRLPGFFRLLNNIQHRRELTALHQIQQLGFQAADVRHIILTHLDFDHAGGITDFPQARLHVMQDEIATAKAQRTWLDRRRYADSQWRTEDGWHGYAPGGESWFGFDAVRDLHGLPPEILLIPLPGHTPGHAGVAIQHANGWLLHGGDAWFYRGEMEAQYRCTPGLRFYQWMMEKDRQARLENQQRLRALAQQQQAGLTLFCSHDAKEYERLLHR
ncbi:MBL fold metallo-hydrolase [Siccibacter colletis]|uniref:MBL fold metallo-hydrolase n=1 Tax=Siccibacter colletis TaxID=1505757 RepID=UPI0028BF58D9|nr:MBL fold metallo-hydrolase [Siccibacter colletis]WNN49419.1 MBL fold metallo-hydrolase [Siccibacter colletis]